MDDDNGSGWKVIVQRNADTKDDPISGLAPLDFVSSCDSAYLWPCAWDLDCPSCGQRVTWTADAGSLAIVKCQHCHCQFPARDGQVVDPGPCDFACGYVEPYGFVPEAGCPVHDLQQEG